MPPTEAPSFFFRVLETQGFPTFMVFVLMAFIWYVGRQIVAGQARIERAQLLHTLALQFAPQFHETAQRWKDESTARSQKRREPMEDKP